MILYDIQVISASLSAKSTAKAVDFLFSVRNHTTRYSYIAPETGVIVHYIFLKIKNGRFLFKMARTCHLFVT